MNRILIGHVLYWLPELPDELVHGICTSPPYWNLRDYRTEPITWPDGWRGSLGLEPTPELYIEHIVEICRELRRVLRSDGFFWLNIGDSYSGSGKGIGTDRTKCKEVYTDEDIPRTDWEATGLKPKDLCLIPFRLAIALQSDGWWVRSACIWYKRNCMPESASDRPTVDYEFVFLLTKAARYFYDGDAVREPHTEESLNRIKYKWEGNRDVGEIPGSYTNMEIGRMCHPAGRNLRTVWDIPTVSYSEAHFATFPPELAARCIKVTPMDVCAECGAGYERLTEFVEAKVPFRSKRYVNQGYAPDNSAHEGELWQGKTKGQTIGFAPTCTCNADKAKAVILDPFAGSGTVGQAANDLGREFILIELNPDYYEFMQKRLGMFCPEPEYIGEPVEVK